MQMCNVYRLQFVGPCLQLSGTCNKCDTHYKKTIINSEVYWKRAALKQWTQLISDWRNGKAVDCIQFCHSPSCIQDQQANASFPSVFSIPDDGEKKIKIKITARSLR